MNASLYELLDSGQLQLPPAPRRPARGRHRAGRRNPGGIPVAVLVGAR